MDGYETEVRDLERRMKVEAQPGSPVVFYGSSSIKLWSTLSHDLDTDRIVNLGFGGSTLDACVRFFDRLVLPIRPASLVVYAGDNDLGDGRTPQEVTGCFMALSRRVQRDLRQVPFGFISIKPSPYRIELLDVIARTNAAIRSEMAGHPHSFYIDVFTPMLGLDGQPRPELFIEDGLHLSRAGYQLWAGILWQYRRELFTKECGDRHITRLA